MTTQKYLRCAWLTQLFFSLFILGGKTQPANRYLPEPDRVSEGDPATDISRLKIVKTVMKGGVSYL